MLPELKIVHCNILDAKDGIVFKLYNCDVVLDNTEVNSLYKWLSERRKISDGFVLVKILPAPTSKDELVFVSGPTSKIIGKNANYNIRKLLADLKSRNLPYDDVVEIIIKYGEVSLSLH